MEGLFQVEIAWPLWRSLEKRGLGIPFNTLPVYGSGTKYCLSAWCGPIDSKTIVLRNSANAATHSSVRFNTVFTQRSTKKRRLELIKKQDVSQGPGYMSWFAKLCTSFRRCLLDHEIDMNFPPNIIYKLLVHSTPSPRSSTALMASRIRPDLDSDGRIRHGSSGRKEQSAEPET